MPNFLPVPEQLELLLKGVETCVQKDELAAKLEASRKSGKPLRVKAGFDPSAPDLHLGHTVVFRKMRHFQELGHEVVFLIGDFTGLIGDPTGKKTTRPQLTREEVDANAETYKAQVFKILDRETTVVDFNSRWLGALGADGLVRLAGRYTVAQLLERDDFAKRFKAGQPISVHELLYPLCQGYDSVALKADVELGGTDQLFNLLVGRELMRSYGLAPQCVMTTPLLVGLDGVEKMSKSLGNHVGVSDPPDEIFGKVMSVSDDMMWTWWTLLTDLFPHDIDALKADVASGAKHPKRVKMDLARQLVTERLTDVRGRLPEGLDPVLGPVATAFGEVYQYVVSGDGIDPMTAKTLHDWDVRNRLRSVPGVSEVNSCGGLTQQYHVVVDPPRLEKYALSLGDVVSALSRNNASFSGGFIEHRSERVTVRGVGLATGVDDLASVVLTSVEGVPITVGDVARVEVGAMPRQGAVTRDGKGESIAGMVIMLKGENGRDVGTRHAARRFRPRHGRHHDTIWKGQAVECKRLEQGRYRPAHKVSPAG